jgi:hypothetical protein
MTGVHTAFPGVVVKYDSATRRADIQPSLKREMPDGSFMEFPILPETPVLFFGTKKYAIHIPLEKGDEVLVVICERSLDKWKETGGKGIEEKDPRRFDLQDCVAIPGLQAVDFIPVNESGLNIVHKTAPDGDLISQVTMDDDKIEMKYKEKAVITMEEDHIKAFTEKCAFDLTGGTAAINNDKLTFKLNSDKFSIKNNSKSLFKILDDTLKELAKLKTVGSPANHNVSPDNMVKFQQLDADLGLVME